MREPLQGAEWTTSLQKRSIDIATASALLPIATPVAALGAAAFTLEAGMNPIFVQDRVDTNAQQFKVIKLRTMPFKRDLADSSNGYMDARANHTGRLLRQTTIDELPQLLQVLSGRMSIVGPRPLVASDVERTMSVLSPREQDAWQKARSVMKPGLLSEFGNMSRTLNPQDDEYLLARVQADLHYAEAASLATDIAIMRDAFQAVLPK